MRAIIARFVCVLSLGAVVACSPERKPGADDDDDGGKMDACVGLECQVVNCQAMGQPDTSVSGTIFAPNGTLPLYGINVYVPREDPGALTEGVTCDQCANGFPGSPIVQTKTDEAGKFTLAGVPAGDNVKLVVTQGKWRRVVTLPSVAQCADTALDPQMTRLPKDKTEGDIPQIAVTSGSVDSLECLIRRLGVADSEFTNATGTGRVHLYNGNGVNKINSSALSPALDLWGNLDTMKKYDIVIFSCESAQNAGNKPQTAMDAVKGYADIGGRVFLSHWHNIWVGGAFQGGGNQKPAVWDQIATWSTADNYGQTKFDLIDEAGNPNGTAFATWMMNVMGSTVRDQVNISGGKNSCNAIDNTKAERWTFFQNGNTTGVQNFQFTTPNEADPATRCGKVVFSDMHVSGGPTSNTFPDSCGPATDLSPQEKALAFMFFDIASCVGVIF